MKNILTFLIIVMPLATFSQPFNIDDKKGFKDFKIGDNLQKWTGQLKELGITTGTTAYLYQGSCCDKIIDYRVKEIKLFFDKSNKLVNIEIKFSMADLNNDGRWLTNEVQAVGSSFKSYFGAPNSESIDYGEFIYFWSGKSVGMTLLIKGDAKSDEAMVIIRDVNKEKLDQESKF